MTSIKPAHEAPGLLDYERDRVRWAEDFAANSSSTQHARLLAALLGEHAPPLTQAGSHYPELTGAAAGVTKTLLDIIARQAVQAEQGHAEVARLRGLLTAAEARHAKTAELLGRYAETATDAADLATDLSGRVTR